VLILGIALGSCEPFLGGDPAPGPVLYVRNQSDRTFFVRATEGGDTVMVGPRSFGGAGVTLRGDTISALDGDCVLVSTVVVPRDTGPYVLATIRADSSLTIRTLGQDSELLDTQGPAFEYTQRC
jgi:hypothetical protein